VMISFPTRVATSSSPRLPLSVSIADYRGRVCVQGPVAGQGTTLPTYGVRVTAFVKGGATPGVRSWSPPV
jgi:hypothetical protein